MGCARATMAQTAAAAAAFCALHQVSLAAALSSGAAHSCVRARSTISASVSHLGDSLTHRESLEHDAATRERPSSLIRRSPDHYVQPLTSRPALVLKRKRRALVVALHNARIIGSISTVSAHTCDALNYKHNYDTHTHTRVCARSCTCTLSSLRAHDDDDDDDDNHRLHNHLAQSSTASTTAAAATATLASVTLRALVRDSHLHAS